jgi:hypothetical protein
MVLEDNSSESGEIHTISVWCVKMGSDDEFFVLAPRPGFG